MTIKPKMYLNASPQTAEEGSLVYAKNVKIDNDGSITSDFGYQDVYGVSNSNKVILGHIIGLDNKIYFLIKDTSSGTTYKITEYDEITGAHNDISNCKWTPESDSSTFTGAVTTNVSGEKILTIAECPPENSTVKAPLKHINLSYPDVNEKSQYCQAPIIPLCNLVFNRTYSKTIPNGTYVFFIRYKIRDDVFTKWYLASRPCFAGKSENIDTLQGGVKRINTHRDSANSFVFKIEAPNTSYAAYYNGFQLGFILTHDEGTVARAWKYFDFSFTGGGDYPTITNTIYFDYDDVSEISIEELTEPTYEIYNVKNVSVFKNKLYISNYIESDVSDNSLSDITVTSEIVANQEDYTVLTDISTSINNRTVIFRKTSNGFYAPINTSDFEWRKVKDNSIYNVGIDTEFGTIFAEKSRVDKDAYSCVIACKLSESPDVAIVYDIKNKLKRTKSSILAPAVFGGSYKRPRTSVLGSSWIDYGNGYRKFYMDLDSTHPFHGDYLSDMNVLDRPGLAYACIHQTTNSDEIDSLFQSYILGSTDSEWTVYPIKSSTAVSFSVAGTSEFQFIARNRGLNTAAKELIINDVKSKIEAQSTARVIAVELYSGSNVYIVDLSNTTNTSNINNMNTPYFIPFSAGDGVLHIEQNVEEGVLNNTVKDVVLTYLNSITTNNIVGITYNGELVFQINGNYIAVNTVKIKLKDYKFEVETSTITDSDSEWVVKLNTNMTVTDYSIICDIKLKNNLNYSGNNTTYIQSSTLMPLSTYNVYLHEVTKEGIITDGKLVHSFNTNNYPTYNKLDLKLTLTLPNTSSHSSVSTRGFFSIINVGNLTAKCFDYNRIGNDNYLSCIELDCLLYNETVDLELFISDGTNTYSITTPTIEYLPSSVSNPPMAFGNCGLLHWRENVDYSSCKTFILIINRTLDNSKDRKLIKATHYFNVNIQRGNSKVYDLSNTSTQSNTIKLKDVFYGSYVCNIRKPSFVLSSSVYVSGNDINAVKRINKTIRLEEFNAVIQTTVGDIRNICSNYNLNYLSLTEDINDKLFKVGTVTSGVKQVARVINSATLSYIYELRSMYKDFFNVYFRPLQTYYKTKFDNTVRVSNVLSDETYNNDVYKFRAIDYYNVPTDRGKIIKLFSIGNNIYVHTERSLYKFDGNQTITASKSDITLKESEPFETGIVQVFDSEYGYGGIMEQSASCITFDSYFFYDQENNHIFGYRDNQPILIDNSIKGFLDIIKLSIKHCNVVHDINNNRILFGFDLGYVSVSGTTNHVTCAISYNYKSKSFVSLHSINLEHCFNSKNNVYYSNTSTLQILFPLNWAIDDNNIYGAATNDNSITLNSSDIDSASSLHKFEIAVVVYPKQQLLEAISFVKYIAKTQDSLYRVRQRAPQSPILYDSVDFDFNSFNAGLTVNPIKNAFIITDRCKSNVISDEVNDELDGRDATTTAVLNNVKGFKFERGTWNFNYFRNVLNDTDIYKYHEKDENGNPLDGYSTINGNSRNIKSDLNSLVYGRYFIIVLRFIEDTPVKLEDIFVQTEQY